MKKEQDGFILMDKQGFSEWLKTQNISRQIKRVQNHHTWKPDYTHFNGNDHFSRLRSMKNHHVNTNGWSDIAQNLTTFPDGTIAVCRSLNTTPVGIKGANTGGICIEHLGNFDEGQDEMTEAHKDTIIYLNAELCAKFNFQPNTQSIVYHHWYDLQTGERKDGKGTTKTCPGTHFMGGNKVKDAENHFIPEVLEVFRTLQPDSVHSGDILASGEVTASGLNVRSGAGTDYGIVDSLSKGTRVNIYEKSDGWYRINSNENWISAGYVKITEGSPV